MDATFLSERLACSQRDKLACMETVQALKCMADGCCGVDARSLDALAPTGDGFLMACVEALGELENREALKNVLTGYLLAEDRQGREFLHRLLAVHGTMLLFDKRSGQTLTRSLQGWFGAGFRETYWAELTPESPVQGRTESVYPEFDVLGEAYMPHIVRLAFEINATTLALALTGAAEPVADKFLRAVSTNEKREAVENLMEEKKNAPLTEVVDAQRWICEYSQKLREECPEF